MSANYRLFLILVLAFAVTTAGCEKKDESPKKNDAVESAAQPTPGTAASIPPAYDPWQGHDDPQFVVAEVDGEPIRLKEVKRVFEGTRRRFGGRGMVSNPQVLGRIRDMTIERMISTQLITKASHDAGITVTDKEADEKLASIVEQSGGDREKLVEHLKNAGITFDEFKLQVREDLARSKFIDSILEKQKIDDKELKAEYEKRKGELGKVRASHILLKTNAAEGSDEDKKKKAEIEKILADVRGGKIKFDEAAKKYSEGPTKVKGGDLGFFEADKMVPPFSKAAFALKVDEISEPVRTRFGWHIIKKTGESTPDEAMELIRNEKKGKIVDEEIRRLREKAVVKINLTDVSPLPPMPPGHP